MADLRDRVAERLGADTADPRWRDQLAELLYDGESVRETVDVGDARVVVTSHRVLAFDPNADGKRFQQVQRPNVLGVTTGANTERSLLARGSRWIAYGGIMIVTGALVDLDSVLGDVSLGGSGGGVGLGGVLGVLQGMLDLLRQLDDLLQFVGGLVLLLGGLALGAYLLTRDTCLVVRVAGDDADLRVQTPDDARDVAERLETAIRPDDDRDGGDVLADEPRREA